MKIKLGKFLIEFKITFLIVLIMSIISKFIRTMFYYYYACYLFIMFHEFAHIFIATLFNYKCNKIEFSICGMSANILLTNKSKKEILIYLAGPVSNLIFALLFRNVDFILKVNLVLCFINLVPVYPLDGYRIFRLLKLNTRNLRVVIYLLIFLAIIATKNFSLCIFLVYILFLRLNLKDREFLS